MKKIKNKKLLIFLLIILLGGIYLYLAHFFIYYRLGHSDLLDVERQAVYDIGDSQASSATLVYVALGDSFTAGRGASSYQESFPYLLAEKLAKDKSAKITLKNFSSSGVRTSQLIAGQLDQAISAKPDIITLLIGTNDVHGNIKEAVFQKNYIYILDQLVQKTPAKIYLIGLPNNGTDGLLWPPYGYYFRQKTKAYNQIIQGLAEDYGLTYIDLEKGLVELSEQDGYYSQDLFHPSTAGYQLWSQIIYADVNK